MSTESAAAVEVARSITVPAVPSAGLRAVHLAAWEPPRKVMLLWQIGANWQYAPDFETEVDVTFSEEGSAHSRVDLHHRNLQRYGDATDQMRAIFERSEGPGWHPRPVRRPGHHRNLMVAEGSALSTMQLACGDP